jgi:hypothetical protein
MPARERRMKPNEPISEFESRQEEAKWWVVEPDAGPVGMVSILALFSPPHFDPRLLAISAAKHIGTPAQNAVTYHQLEQSRERHLRGTMQH